MQKSKLFLSLLEGAYCTRCKQISLSTGSDSSEGSFPTPRGHEQAIDVIILRLLGSLSPPCAVGHSLSQTFDDDDLPCRHTRPLTSLSQTCCSPLLYPPHATSPPSSSSGILLLAECASSKRNSSKALCPIVCIQVYNGSYYLATPRHGFGPARLTRILHSLIRLIFSFRLWRRRRQCCCCSLPFLIFCACTRSCY